MKKLMAGLCLMGLCFLGCQDPPQTNKQSQTEERENGVSSDQLVLNNGQKWEANKETMDGVKKIQVVIKNRPKQSLEDFDKLGKELTKIENYIVRKCTMKGEAHENLHLWLNPLMKKTEKLNESEGIAQAQEIVRELEIHLKEYYRYFE